MTNSETVILASQVLLGSLTKSIRGRTVRMLQGRM